jgi:hypothetical protein
MCRSLVATTTFDPAADMLYTFPGVTIFFIKADAPVPVAVPELAAFGSQNEIERSQLPETLRWGGKNQFISV